MLSSHGVESSISTSVSAIELSDARNQINNLAYAEGASWDPADGMLPGTRIELMDDVLQWIEDGTSASAAEIFCLLDFAGSGKTAFSHSLAERCRQRRIMVSSFFLDRHVA